MENDFRPGRSTDQENAEALLSSVQDDRSRLSRRVRTPRWVAPGFGLIAAFYVATPAFPGDRAGGVVLTTAIVAAIAMIHVSRRDAGVRFSRLGFRGWAAFAVATVSTLALFSVALGLAAGDLHGWIIAPVCAAFGLVSWLATILFSSMRDGLVRVR